MSAHHASVREIRCDVAVIGGGLVGASLACALAPLGVRVTLVEAVAPRAAAQPSYDDRTLALSDSSCRILQSLGVWADIEPGATPIREIQVRELERPGVVVLKPDELGLDRFGHVVEARAFGAVMMEVLPRLPGLERLCPARLSGLEVDGAGARMEVNTEQGDVTVRAPLVVGADGADSFVREALAIPVERFDYGQTAVICNVTPEQEHRGRAFECFTPTGPIAVLPHVGQRCGLVWCVETERAPGLLELPEVEFLEQANRRFGGHLGAFLRMGRRSSYPLRLVRARDDVRPRAVIIGNAAHAIHPVGAQGFNLGLRDAAVLAEVLAEDRRRNPGGDIGRPELLRRYSRWRAPDHEGTIGYSDGLARLFSNTGGLASAARTAALLAHAFVPTLRRQLAVRAMGYRGRVPRLARGEPL